MNTMQGRIESIDVLRGFSLLGILIMNIVSFGLPFASYVMPHLYGGITGANLTVWLVTQVLFEGKMRCLFSMLFGASALLLTSRIDDEADARRIYYKRLFWLIVIGVIHAHLIWYGDILFAYGVTGLLLYPLRKLTARTLILAGVAVVIAHSAMNLGGMFAIREMKVEAAKPKPDPKAAKDWAELRSMLDPSPAKIEEEIRAMRGSWFDVFTVRTRQAREFETTMFPQFMFPDIFGMLLLGMGLGKAGVFSATRSYRFYGILALAGFGFGIPLNYWAAVRWIQTGFALPEWFGYINATSDPGRFSVALGYTGLVMLMCKAEVLGAVRRALAGVGRTALSNYLLTSILATLLFNGYGFGLFARLERVQLPWVVLAIWAVNLTVTPLWLRVFRQGPAEWVWRSLTYGKLQPMSRSLPAGS